MTGTTEPRPEQQFFDDPAVDRLLGIVMSLAAELWVVKDRQHVLESLLGDKEIVALAELDTFQPDEAHAARIAAERQAFVKSLMDNLLALEQSKSGD